MTASRILRAASTLALLWALCAPTTWAEGPPAASDRPTVSSVRGDGEWRYNTYYLYPLTRHSNKNLNQPPELLDPAPQRRR